MQWNCMCWLIFHHKQRWFLQTKNSDKSLLKDIMLMESLPSKKNTPLVVVLSHYGTRNRKKLHYYCAVSYGTKTLPLLLNKNLLEKSLLTKIVTHTEVSTVKIISLTIMCKTENILVCTAQWHDKLHCIGVAQANLIFKCLCCLHPSCLALMSYADDSVSLTTKLSQCNNALLMLNCFCSQKPDCWSGHLAPTYGLDHNNIYSVMMVLN